MFIDSNNQEKAPPAKGGGLSNLNKKIIIYFVFILLLVLLIGGALFLFQNKFIKKVYDEEEAAEEESEEIKTPASLRSIDDISPAGEGQDGGEAQNGLKAEYLTFGQFYKKDKIEVKPAFSLYDLPLNVKTDVANYYEVSRKINLDPYIEALNKDGFVIIDNPFKSEANDFFSVYGLLYDKSLPSLITSDFIVYYYQHFIKQIFKQIENDFFYQDFFNINKSFFNIANERYRERSKKEGIKNDPILEAERLEAVFFAVALELLKPIANQKESLNFTSPESNQFTFSPPDYLSDQVTREVNLVRAAKQKTKSPVTLYERDYSVFKVPVEYQTNAKLNNFYLATKWMNTLFPLYFQSSDCPGCLLDKDDWLVNFTASSFIAEDLAASQSFKNQWAKIYKTIAFFSGLRADLTYLHYHEALTKIFGPDYDIEKIFANENSQRDKDIAAIEKELSQYQFYAIEGGYPREDKNIKPILGLRMLTEPYWPNEFIFSELAAPSVSSYQGEMVSKENKTFCKSKEGGNFRCRGFNLDIINLVYDVKNKSSYFIENTDYQGYDSQIEKLRSRLSKFNVNSWYNNRYWMTLQLLKYLLNPELERASFARSENWENKEISSAIGAWINFQLPTDTFVIKSLGEKKGLRTREYGLSTYYVEPNLELIKEMQATSKMLLAMLEALKFTAENVSLSNIFKDLDDNLARFENIIIKEFRNEPLTEEDYDFINRFTNQYKIEKNPVQSVAINLSSAKENMIEMMEGVKILIAVNDLGKEKVFIFGPLFDYKEEY